MMEGEVEEFWLPVSDDSHRPSLAPHYCAETLLHADDEPFAVTRDLTQIRIVLAVAAVKH